MRHAALLLAAIAASASDFEPGSFLRFEATPRDPALAPGPRVPAHCRGSDAKAGVQRNKRRRGWN